MTLSALLWVCGKQNNLKLTAKAHFTKKGDDKRLTADTLVKGLNEVTLVKGA